MKSRFLLAPVLVVALSSLALARDPAQVRKFRRDHPCPSTGKKTGACPGWVVDHVWSLCLGGPDIPENMVWQSQKESYVKDKYEREMCAMKKKLK